MSFIGASMSAVSGSSLLIIFLELPFDDGDGGGVGFSLEREYFNLVPCLFVLSMAS